MAENYKFTREERSLLLDSWKRKADKATAEKYIDSVERLVDTYITNPPYPPEDRSPQQNRADHKKIHDLSAQLRVALLTQSPPRKEALGAHIHVIARLMGYDAEPGIILEQLLRYLEIVEFAQKRILKNPTPNTARQGDALRQDLMSDLSMVYLQYFHKKPSMIRTGNFRVFLKTLSSIIDIPLGSGWAKRSLKTFKILEDLDL